MKLVVSMVVASVCYAGGAPPPPPMAPISLFMQNQNAPPEVLQALQEEVGSILAPAGFRFEWYNLTSAKTAGPAESEQLADQGPASRRNGRRN